MNEDNFEKIPGTNYKLYVPKPNNKPKKHPCADCFNCLWCADEKCAACLNKKNCCKNPLLDQE